MAESQNTNTSSDGLGITTSMSEWNTLREVVIDWLENHPDLQMDDLLASWLDPSQRLFRDYKVS